MAHTGDVMRNVVSCQARQERHDAIAAYAAEMAGTNLDLDRELESAGIVCLITAHGHSEADSQVR
jgi:hypothetical protein